MESQELIARIDRTTKAWNDLTPLSTHAYDLLLKEDDFWDPSSGVVWSRPIFWQEMGNA
jgi:hypothetical protein